MPLFKGQGCKSRPGKAIDYITDKNKAAIVTSQNLDDSRSYAQQFQETAEGFGKGVGYDERKYYHFKLSCNRADEVAASAHHEFAEALAAKLFPGHECVIATHTDTGTVHSHIIVNAVNFEEGKKLHCNNREYQYMKDLADEMGKERGFTELHWREAAKKKHQAIERGVPQPETQAEKNIILRGGTSWKEELREVITLAKQDTKTMPEFESYLREYGVELTRNTGKTIAYKHPKKEKAIRGERLGEEYTKGAVENELEQNRRHDSQREVAAESGAEANGNREYAAESSVGRVERTVREIAERVHGLTSDGRAEKAARAAEMERVARDEAAGVEQECQRAFTETERECCQPENGQSVSDGYDFEPDF